MSLAKSLVASSSRPLALRQRADLVTRRQQFDGEACWVVKDPCALRYFRLSDREHAVLRMLDGQASLDDIRRELSRKFPRDVVGVKEIHRFLGRLHDQGLIFSQAESQARELRRRAVRRRWKTLASSFANVLAIRLRGIDPGPLLERLYPSLRWCFTPACLLACAALILAALGLVTVEFDAFLAKLPTAESFFTPWTIPWLLLAMALLKILHELGHALACRHLGGRCHEIGLMFLLLTPCLYCNVSDSWMLPNKWHRAAIGAAGMFVELVVAAACTFLWWFSNPGLLNQICLSVMVVGSATTILFNANPLMKFDGYYILCDLWELPGLAGRARNLLRQSVSKLTLGIDLPSSTLRREHRPRLLIAYALSAMCWRGLMILSIGWALYQSARAWQAESLVVLLFVLPFVIAASVGGRRAWKNWFVPGRARRIRASHVRRTCTFLGAIVVLALLAPYPYHVVCPVELQPRGAQWVYVQVQGKLDRLLVRPGDLVRPGQPLALLLNPELELDRADVAGRLEKQRFRLAALRSLRAEGDHRAASSLEEARQELQHLHDQLTRCDEDLARLTLRAQRSGVVVPAPRIPEPPETSARLPAWHGSPLDPENAGCRLRTGDVLCLIADPRDLEAVLTVDQVDVGDLRVGQRVTIEWDAWPGRRWVTAVAEISRRDAATASPRMSNRAGGAVAAIQDDEGQDVPLGTIYLARAPLPPAEELPVGLRGTARVRAGSRSFLARVRQFLEVTFHFRM